MNRRTFLATMPPLLAARHALAAGSSAPGRLGVCTFSCHRAWGAIREKSAVVPFADGPTFYDYVRRLGADGAQTGLSTLDEATATRLRRHVEETGGYYEGDLRLPTKDSELKKFEHDVQLARLAGATVARAVLSGSRRYETWKTLDAFTAFRTESSRRLARIEPILKKHRLKLAVENHKDLTGVELAGLMREFNSEWLGVNVDTGNNLALLEDPYETVEALAPFALSVHLKDMALQPHAHGFLLSEVNCGQGFLDLPRIASILRKANPRVCFNLEMATRDPLLIPCLDDGYFVTFPDRKATHLAAAMDRMRAHPPKQPPPTIAGHPITKQLADEEANNRVCLEWMHQRLT
jgi:sugar phosphate isomerase/epimerase